MPVPDTAALLAAHAALPEPYQPAWGLEASREVASRACDDRLAAILPLLEALPGDGVLRILDLGCAQGYFTLAIAHALGAQGRTVEIVGVDYLEDNVRFCASLAVHHGIAAKFVHAKFDDGFFERVAPGGWDVVLALNVLHHIQQQGDAAAAIAAMRAHARVLLCELAQREEALDWVKTWHVRDTQLLGGYAFQRRLAEFPTHLGDVRRPLYACSDGLAWVGGRWFTFEHVADRSHPGVPEAFAGQRRFLFGADTVIKAYRGDGRYGDFNRAELAAEAAVLTELADEPNRYPSVLAKADDGDRVWLVRGLLPGRLLSECIETGAAFDRDAIVRGLLDELVRLEARGFHHGDLRCWNVLLDGDNVRLIDFGAMTHERSPMQRVALAAVLLEIAEGTLQHAQLFYTALQPLGAYPRAWWALLHCLLGTPEADFSFARALAALDAEVALVAASAERLAPDPVLMAAVARAQCEGFERAQAHAGVLEHDLGESRRYIESLLANRVREQADAATERDALQVAAREAATYADSLKRALDVSHEHADSLARELDATKAYAASQAAQLAWMRHRFRWLKPLWPRQPDIPKDPE